MKTLIAVIILSGLIFSCSETKKESTAKQKLLIQNSTERNFSNSNSKDKFIISIIGNTILEGEMVFQIINSEGEELLNEKYPSNYLIGFGYDQYTTIAGQEKFIKKRVKEFFKDENFFEPAISADEEYDIDYSNENIWNDIKSDPTTIGFYYLIGEERGCRIAYSKKENKVLTYFCCC